ncbi:6208_t:CDS:1, partial [Cetraspora pellucida]
DKFYIQEKIPNDKINYIINISVDYWITSFNTKHLSTSEARDGFLYFINTINNTYYDNQNINLLDKNNTFLTSLIDYTKKKIGTILTNNHIETINYWAEKILYHLTHHIYREILLLNKNTNQKLIDRLNLNKKSNEKNINPTLLRIDEVLLNLDINFSQNDTIEEKIDKIITYSKIMKEF